jgi:hydroxymethylbilane synthase
MVLIATRASALARCQAEAVRAAMAAANPGLELALLEVSTRGDRLQDVSLEATEGTGFFTDAIEQALLEGRAELGAHSLKDVPTAVPAQFVLSAVLPRADPRDVIVSPHGGLDRLPEGALVGTDSSRRREQIGLVRPDLRFQSVRGNVPTRLAKLDAGDYDALVLAAAGLDRLGLGDRITEHLDPDVCLPAPGQGAIAVETVAGGEWEIACRRATDADAEAATRAERAFLAALGGGCETPVGALATREGHTLRLRGVMVENGRAERVELDGGPDEPERLGALAARLLRGMPHGARQ